MTDLDKQAANAAVARAMGWRLTETRSLNGEPMFDNGRHLQEFDLFAHSAAGALAREEAEQHLLEHHIFLRPGGTKEYAYWCEVKDHSGKLIAATQVGTTLAEARATAICNAVLGMREDKNG